MKRLCCLGCLLLLAGCSSKTVIHRPAPAPVVIRPRPAPVQPVIIPVVPVGPRHPHCPR